jgi:hypothetical protein
MRDINLYISKKDWGFISVVSLLLSSLVSLLLYRLFDLDTISGVFFGIFSASCIFGMVYLLINLNNYYILPKIDKSWWNTSSFLHSFCGGYFGMKLSFMLLDSVEFLFIPHFIENLEFIASIIGLSTYLVGYIIYRFVQAKNIQNKMDKMLLKARLSTLEAQLNPHFLYNSLNTITELIHIDQDIAEKAVINLSKYLRIGMKESSLVPIKEELEFVKNYIELQKIRFCIEYSLVCDEKTKDIMVPKYSIQLLVENSIKHAFKNQKDFCIDVECKECDGYYSIEVRDNADEIKNLKYGIGLKNLDERLKILTNAKLEYKNSPKRFIIKGKL